MFSWILKRMVLTMSREKSLWLAFSGNWNLLCYVKETPGVRFHLLKITSVHINLVRCNPIEEPCQDQIWFTILF